MELARFEIIGSKCINTKQSLKDETKLTRKYRAT